MIPSLLLAGPLSDAIGRRRVLLPAVGAAVIGAASGALTAALVELEPDGNRPRAAMISAMALFAGIGLGPLLSGVLAQYVTDPRVVPYPALLRLGGLSLILAGLVLLILAGSAGSLALLLAATLAAGVGQGLAFLAAMTQINHVVPADRRADVLSSFYVVTYAGTGVPVIGVGFLATAIGLLTAVQYFAGVVALGCAVALAVLAARYMGQRARAGMSLSATG